MWMRQTRSASVQDKAQRKSRAEPERQRPAPLAPEARAPRAAGDKPP